MQKKKKFKLGPKQKKWIKALKSGKYKQSKNTLYNKETAGYCCLGVANEVCDLKEKSDSTLLNAYKKLGLNDDDGEIVDGYKFPRGKKKYRYLTDMNDKGVSFSKIAEFIESHPEKVFTRSI